MNQSTQKGRVAVLVPLYKEVLTPVESFSLRNTLSVLAARDTYLIAPERLGAFLEAYGQKINSNAKLALYPDKWFASISGYNALMMRRWFYEDFSAYDYILIVQTDALVFADQLDDWCGRGYSYVGAPWISSGTGSNGEVRLAGVGNGGLSLRKVRDFIEFLSTPRHVPNPTLEQYYPATLPLDKRLMKYVHQLLLSYNFPPVLPRVSEDVFWGMLAPLSAPFFTVPAPEEAVAFAFEACPEQLFELNHRQLPFGCHAWEKFAPDFWRRLLADRGIELP